MCTVHNSSVCNYISCLVILCIVFCHAQECNEWVTKKRHFWVKLKIFCSDNAEHILCPPRRLYVLPGVCLSVYLLAISRKNYWLDLLKILRKRYLWTRKIPSSSGSGSRMFEAFFNIARRGSFPQFGSYLWNNWLDFHENFTTDVSLD